MKKTRKPALKAWMAGLISTLLLVALLVPPAAAQTPAPTLPPVSIDVPYESQIGNQNKIGESESTIDRYGCGISSLAMVFRRFGLDTDTDRTNSALSKAGLLSDAYLVWDQPSLFSKATGDLVKSIEYVWTSKTNNYQERVNQELSANNPVMAYLSKTTVNDKGESNTKTHYVVITGRDAQGNFTINDPYKNDSAAGKDIPFNQNAIGASLSNVVNYAFISSTDAPPTNGIPLIPEVAGTYRLSGGSRGPLRNPLRKGEDLAGWQGVRWQEFQGGAIYRIADRPEGYALYTPIWKRYVAEGGPGKMGLPLRGIYAYPSHGTIEWQADFEKGSILWSDGDAYSKIRVLLPDSAIRVEYFDNADLSGQPAYTRLVESIRQHWGSGRPDMSVKNLDSHSIRWSGSLNVWFPLGWSYNFREQINGNYRIFIDGNLIVDGWGKPGKDSFSQYLKEEYMPSGLNSRRRATLHMLELPGQPGRVYAAPARIKRTLPA